MEQNTPTQQTPDYSGPEYKSWRNQRAMIPEMIAIYCHGVHKTPKKEPCAECLALTEYAVFRLDKCPFKKDKSYCAFCRIHCYQEPYRTQIKAVMKYSGPRMLWSHPIFAMSHVVQLIRFKAKLKKQKRQEKQEQQKQK